MNLLTIPQITITDGIFNAVYHNASFFGKFKDNKFKVHKDYWAPGIFAGMVRLRVKIDNKAFSITAVDMATRTVYVREVYEQVKT